MRVAMLAGMDFKGGWYVLGDPGVDFAALKQRFKEIAEEDGTVKVEGKSVAMSRVILFNSSGPAKRMKFHSPDERAARAKELAALKKAEAKAPETVAKTEGTEVTDGTSATKPAAKTRAKAVSKKRS